MEFLKSIHTVLLLVGENSIKFWNEINFLHYFLAFLLSARDLEVLTL